MGFNIGGLDPAERVIVVAEIGNNHEGDVALAERLIDSAAEAGADAVKFQTFRTELFISPAARERYERFKRFELRPRDFERLAARTRTAGLRFLSTPLDLDSIAVLEPLVDAFKIASGDNNFYALLARIAVSGKPVVLSGGLATIGELEIATRVIRDEWERAACPDQLAILHCVSGYPVPPEQANLSLIPRLARDLRCIVGYSDHTLGIDAAVGAVAIGARIIEKHFTIDKQQSDFRDHHLSADPRELRVLVERIRVMERMRGDGTKTLQPVERSLLTEARRSIALRRALPAGSRVHPEDLVWTRPGGGLPPGRERSVIGRCLTRDVKAGEQLQPSMFETPVPAAEPIG